MESHTTTLFLVLLSMTMASSSSPATQQKSQNLALATDEMLQANYFTFVMLINMSPPDIFQGNITFLMPNDRLLAGITDLSPDSVTGFLLRHSIPSPLLFETLRLLPSGTVMPSSEANYTISVSNNGRKSYFLNNVRLISPNICSHMGSTVRCHGINGVLSENYTNPNSAIPCSSSNQPNPNPSPAPTPSPNPSPSTPEGIDAPPSSKSSPALAPATTGSVPDDGNNSTFAIAPSPAANGTPAGKGSGSGSRGRHVSLFVSCFVVLVTMVGLFV